MMKIAEELKAKIQHMDALYKANDEAGRAETNDEWIEKMLNPTPEMNTAEAAIKKAGAELDEWRREHEAELDEWRRSCGAYINPKWVGDGMDACDKWLMTVNRETVEGYPYTCPESFDEKKALGLR